jgi:hypothetical protein
MKVEFETIDELQAFIRTKMESQMRANVASMRQCGASDEAIQEMCDSTEQRIVEACDEVAETFEAAQAEFNAPVALN